MKNKVILAVALMTAVFGARADLPEYNSRWFRFTITAKHSYVAALFPDTMQLAEFALYNAKGEMQSLKLTQFSGDVDKLPEGQYHYSNGGSGSSGNTSNLFDGNLGTKANWNGLLSNSATYYQIFTIHLPKTSEPICAYNLFSAGDTAGLPQRAPCCWKLEASVDGVNWILADEKNDPATSGYTTENNTWYNGGTPYAFETTEPVGPAEHDHEQYWDEGTVTKSPTCTEGGRMRYTCTFENCYETKDVDVEALGHDPVTHEDSMFVYETCGRCGAQISMTKKENPTLPDLNSKWFRLTIMKKNPSSTGDHMIQLAEFGLYSYNGLRQNKDLKVCNNLANLAPGQCYYANNPNDTSTYKLFDGNRSGDSKFGPTASTDLESGSPSGYLVIVMRLLDSTPPVIKYNICSANDTGGQPQRAVTAWKLEASTNGEDWVVADYQAEGSSGFTTQNSTWYNNGGTGADPTTFYQFLDYEPEGPAEHDHDLYWDEGTYKKKPTCTEGGRVLYACTFENCYETKEVDVDALGHDLVTTEQRGYAHTACTRCRAETALERLANAPLAKRDSKWVRLTIRKKLGVSDSLFQISEFALYNKKGVRQNLGLTKASALNKIEPGQAYYQNVNSGAEALFDGNRGTKVCQALSDELALWNPEWNQIITMRLRDDADPVKFYNICSADDTGGQPQRAVTAWEVELSADGVNWVIADSQTEATSKYTTKSYTWYNEGGSDDAPKAFYGLNVDSAELVLIVR